MTTPPTDTAGIESLLREAAAQEESGHFARSFELLRRCSALCGPNPEPKVAQALNAGLLRLNPLWWSTLAHGTLKLRRSRGSDAAFFRRCHEDRGFARQFNRRQAWRGNLESALENAGRAVPLKAGLQLWVVETTDAGAVGLASLSSLDLLNRRAEFSIGFPDQVPNMLGAKTSLMVLHFALVLMPFNKVYSYIYEDNPSALHNAVRLGFVHEGLLHEHFAFAGEGFVSVNQIGLTRAQIHASVRLKTLARKMIGQHW